MSIWYFKICAHITARWINPGLPSYISAALLEVSSLIQKREGADEKGGWGMWLFNEVRLRFVMRGETKTNLALKKKKSIVKYLRTVVPAISHSWFIDVPINMDTFYYAGFPLRYGLTRKAVTIWNHINNYCYSLEFCT